jgi:type IV secretory pathway protease TraF
VVLNLTDSVYFTFAFYRQGPITKGQYVEFQFNHPLVRDGERVRLTKRVACVSGDRLKTKGRYLYCNDRFLGEALEKTASGKLLDVFVFDDFIPEGMVYLSGDSATSFDSRYWGLMDIAQLNRVVPIW